MKSGKEVVRTMLPASTRREHNENGRALQVRDQKIGERRHRQGKKPFAAGNSLVL
jgi:hypothetical protein